MSVAKFRKKPVVIEAAQWLPNDMEAAGYVVGWMMGRCDYEMQADRSLSIRTLEGIHRADPGDWIIRGIQGEFYPCKPDIFEQTYEPVTASGSSER